MASMATLTFSSSSSTTSSSLFAQTQKNPLSLSLSKPNCTFLSPSIPPASQRLSIFPVAQPPMQTTKIFASPGGMSKLTKEQQIELIKTMAPWGEKLDIKKLVEKAKNAQVKPAKMPEEIFAVVMIGSRQYIVIPGRWIQAPRLKGANANDKIVLNKVLLVGTKNSAYVGKPVVTNAVVHAVVEEQLLDDKVIVFKYKAKKNYRRNIGHRQPITRIRITGITGYEDYPASTLGPEDKKPFRKSPKA